MRLSQLIAAEHESLSALEARDVGKSIKQARADVTVLARYFEFYAGAADKVGGETIPLPGNFTAMTLREPHGVVGAILPWNSPTQMFGRTSAPALRATAVVDRRPILDSLRIATGPSPQFLSHSGVATWEDPCNAPGDARSRGPPRPPGA